jgi:hypothetical protein
MLGKHQRARGVRIVTDRIPVLINRRGKPAAVHQIVDAGNYLISWYAPAEAPLARTQAGEPIHNHKLLEAQGYVYVGEGWSVHKDLPKGAFYVKWRRR